MGTIKGNCKGIPNPCPSNLLTAACPAWEVHPSLKIAIDSLEHYVHWVSEVVVPVAFQWIEENKEEVLERIPREYREKYKDDVGVIFAAAFEIVKEQDWYIEGLEVCQKVEQERRDGTLDTARFNPVWTDIARTSLECIGSAFRKYRSVLHPSVEDDPDCN